MAKTKSSTKKSSGAQKIDAGPSGQMQKFSGVGPQAAGVTAVTKHAGKGAKFAAGGPSGKMQKFVAVKGQKPGGTAVTNSGGGSYAKK